ncbi:MAG TPA: 2-C-methyl-D-erythritol 4-phosphate cytidylyltransferase [Sphingobacteriaceae bacterium]|nr:2-C-methyl-D-erythritol 4-phosphate cytidylyltransferase [Sphingobacteriaceae bacterium]
MAHYAIIVAGGKGHRMDQDVPKQFLLLKGKPVLMYSIEAFHKENENNKIVLVLSDAFHNEWSLLCKKHKFTIPHALVSGGKERFDSVKNGLNFIFNNEPTLDNILIAIHDGARPLITGELINSIFRLAEVKKCVVPAIQSSDSIRLKTDEITSTSIPREKVFLIQTPQVFSAKILKEAYTSNFDPNFTDDASVVEKAGFNVYLIDGDIKNIKITYPTDMILADYWLN